ncbi:MAG: amidohydrolase family protein [Vicinamibacterales bacterium]
MLTRREMMGALGAGVVRPRGDKPSRGERPIGEQPVRDDKPSGLSISTVNFAVPSGACDCHVHVLGDPTQFPFFAGRVYTPEVALPEELAALHKALGIQRVVIITPSVYGADNAATLYGMKARGKDARGIAVIDGNTTDRDLDAMGDAGIRGIRLNLATGGVNDPAVGRQRFQAALTRVQRRHWHIQMNTTPVMIAAIKDLVLASPVPVVLDHFGGAAAAHGAQQPGFADLVELVRSGRAYVKISGAYRASALPDFADVVPLAKALIGANPDRILWGTDWPHPDSATVPGRKPTDLAPRLKVDDGLVMNQLPIWAPDTNVRRKILVENPAKLYGF